MSKKNHYGEAEILEVTRVRLENAEKQPVIAKEMAEFGYGPEKIVEGWAVRKKTVDAYEFKRKEDLETSEAYAKFNNLQKEIAKTYSRDRKKGKAVFGKMPEVMNRLDLNGSIPETYIKWHELVKTYYVTTLAEETLQKALATLKVSPEHLQETLTKITGLESARADYLREKGESQEATSLKDAAFAALDDWMRDFIRIAKIALEDHPELLVALHIKG